MTKCPQNFNITSNLPVEVIWPNGYATDNVGVASLTFNPPNGTRFMSDSRTKVTMVATDRAGNNASCIMEVLVIGKGNVLYLYCAK